MAKEVIALIDGVYPLNKQYKRGQILPDGCYCSSVVGEIRVENGRVFWLWNQGCEDMGKANKTNIEKAIRELKRVEKDVLERMY